MLEYLSSKENLKNGYHLSDILTKTCYVYKDKTIFQEFQNKVFHKLEVDSNYHLKEIKKQVLIDLGNFATRSNVAKLATKSKLNVKQIIYRILCIYQH